MQQKHTILIIDDDRIELGIMCNVLSSAGYRALIAEDGETGYHRAIFAMPDLILLDVMMPGVDGYETCKMLRNNKRTQHIPIFFKTGISGKQAIINGLRSGIDNYFTKPCNHDQLLRQIKSRLAATQCDHLETRLHAPV